MKKVEIVVNGKAYPCRQTMGAMLRFKRETGKEVTEMDSNGFSDICTFLWCCVVSACKCDGVDFNMSLLEFADGISPEDLAEWNKAVQGEETGGGEKKSR